MVGNSIQNSINFIYKHTDTLKYSVTKTSESNALS